jgi:hypothetical protein
VRNLGDRQILFCGDSGERDGRLNVVSFQAWEIGEYFLDGVTVSLLTSGALVIRPETLTEAGSTTCRVTGPICARAFKVHILRRLDRSGHQDWPVMSANR